MATICGTLARHSGDQHQIWEFMVSKTSRLSDRGQNMGLRFRTSSSLLGDFSCPRDAVLLLEIVSEYEGGAGKIEMSGWHLLYLVY